MMRSLILGSVIIGFACVSTAAIESVSINDAKTLREKLTGTKKPEVTKAPVKKVIEQKVEQKIATKKIPTAKVVPQTPAQKGLSLAREAKDKKDYILAIKRYNFILKYFAKKPEAKMALLDKAEIYKNMGLEEQAQYNKIRAQKMTVVQAGVTPTVGNKIRK